MLSNVHKLNRCDLDEWRKVTVVSDLTKMQRNDEADLRKLTASKNLDLTQEQIDKGEAWKVVGKRGNKRIQLVRLYRDEMVTETGEVRLRDALGVMGKRGRSPGSSPSQPTRRQRIEPGEFGDREVGVRGDGELGEGGSDISSKNVLNSDKPGPDNSANIFRIVYTNARSVIGKIDLLRTYVYDLKPSVVCICEASSNSTINYAYLALDGYNLTVRADGTDTKDGRCRGLLVFVKVGVTAALRVWWSVRE